MLTQTPAQQRITLVATIGSESDGDSLQGQNVNNFPAGALVYVASTKRFYALRKDLSVTQVEGASGNVVNSVGSVATGARWVACEQSDVGTLVAGSLVLSGWALASTDVYFLVSVVTVGGTAGTLHAARTTDHSVTVTSSNGADTSVVVVVLVPVGIG